MKTLLTFTSIFTISTFLTTGLRAQNTFPASGRAGIYTTTPNASLQVAGGARFGRPAQFLDIDSATGNLSFGGNASLRVAGNRYAFQYAGDPDYGLFFNSTNSRYEFRDGAAIPVFYIGANTGEGVFSSTVTVGDYTLPATDGAANQVLKTNGAGVLTWSNDNAGPSAWLLAGNAGTSSAANFLGTTDAVDLVFRSNNIEGMRLTNANRRLGLGTTGPSAKLHVNAAAAEDALRVQTNGTTRLFVSDAGGVSIGTTSSGPAGGLYVAGNTGLGTSAPEADLHVLRASAGVVTANANAPLVIENSTSNFINLLTPDANEKGILFGDVSNNSDGGIIYNSSNSMQFRTNGNTTRMTLNSAGNLEMEGDGTGIIFNGGQSIRDNTGAGFSEIEVHGDLVPDVTNSHSLGSSTQEWIDVWAIDGSINLASTKTTKNVKDLSYGLKEILKLRPVAYNRINSPEGGDGPKRLGILADEIKDVIPEAVKNWRYSEDQQTKKITKVPIQDLGISLDYVIPVLVKGMQQQQEIIEEQNKKIEALTKLVEQSLNNRSVTSDVQTGDALISNPAVSSIRVVPNPARSSITVEGLEKTGSVSIINMQGRQMLRQAVTGSNATLNISAIPSGTYIIQYLNNGKTSTQKFIKE